MCMQEKLAIMQKIIPNNVETAVLCPEVIFGHPSSSGFFLTCLMRSQLLFNGKYTN